MRNRGRPHLLGARGAQLHILSALGVSLNRGVGRVDCAVKAKRARLRELKKGQRGRRGSLLTCDRLESSPCVCDGGDGEGRPDGIRAPATDDAAGTPRPNRNGREGALRRR